MNGVCLDRVGGTEEPGPARDRMGRGEERRLPGTVQAGRAGNRHRRRSGRHRDGDYRACGIRIHA
jgi:hypothetical protein